MKPCWNAGSLTPCRFLLRPQGWTGSFPTSSSLSVIVFQTQKNFSKEERDIKKNKISKDLEAGPAEVSASSRLVLAAAAPDGVQVTRTTSLVM